MSLDLLSELTTRENKCNPNVINKLNLINNLLETDTSKDCIAFNDSIWNDLSIFKIDGIFSKILRCKTYFGLLTLYQIITTPTYSKPKWQLKIKQLVDVNSKVQLEECNSILQNINSYQSDVLWFIEKRSESEQKLLKYLFFTNKYFQLLNKNRISLYVQFIYKCIMQPCYLIFSPLLCIIVPYFILKFKFKLKMSIVSYISLLKKIVPNSFSMFGRLNLSNKGTIWVYLSTISTILFYFQSIYSQFNQIKQLFDIVKDIKNKVKSITKCFLLVEKLESIVNYDNTKIKVPEYLLNTSNLYTDYLWKYQKIINDDKQIFKDLFKKIGKIDFIVGIANYYLELKNNNYPVCFPEYLNDTTTYLYYKDIWHPLLYKKSITLNSVELGGTKLKRNMLITGPNAGGKSTIAKSICINILLAQSIGISHSSSFSFVPYKTIYTHFRLNDVEGDRSLFQEEIERCAFLLKNKDNGNFIATFDELFCSTSHLEGMSCAFSLCKLLGECKNSSLIVTTHYKLLTKLEETNASFMNCQMECFVKDNIPQFTYNLLKGVSKVQVALKLLEKNKYTKDVIIKADEILNDLVKNEN